MTKLNMTPETAKPQVAPAPGEAAKQDGANTEVARDATSPATPQK
jgi:hypothetical protein